MDNIKVAEKPLLNNVNGFLDFGIACGLKKSSALDLGVVYSIVPSTVFAKFTTNKYKAAPLLVDIENLKKSKNRARLLIVNSGNANACTGEKGFNDSLKTCEVGAELFDVNTNEVLVSSTGVIGVNLDVNKVVGGLKTIHSSFIKSGKEHSNNFSKAIMTTDTKEKVFEVKVNDDGSQYSIYGCCKGSGMIHPNMATMLCYLFTDCNIEDSLLESAFTEIVDLSFNSISVDGDTSTNDTVMIFKNGLANNKIIDNKKSESYHTFYNALLLTATELAKKVVEDGEGATKLIEIDIKNAATLSMAKNIAKSIARSSLVKTAMFGEDANWGRVICAVGYSGENFDTNKLKLSIGDLLLFENGLNHPFDEEAAKEILAKKNITITVDIGMGDISYKYWTCDLSYEYVKINADYRS